MLPVVILISYNNYQFDQPEEFTAVEKAMQIFSCHPTAPLMGRDAGSAAVEALGTLISDILDNLTNNGVDDQVWRNFINNLNTDITLQKHI